MRLKIIKYLFSNESRTKSENDLPDDYFKLSSKDSVTRLELAELLATQPIPSLVTDEYRIIRYANLNASKLTGFSDLKGMMINEILSDDENGNLEVNDSGFDPSKKILHPKNGSEQPVIVALTSVELNNSNYTIYNLVSFTSLQNGQFEQLGISGAKSFDKFESVFEGIGDSIFIIDTEGKIINVNHNASESLQYSKQDLIGNLLSAYIHNEQKQLFQENLSKIKKHNETLIELELVSADGRRNPSELSACLIDFEGDNVIVCVARNRTNRIDNEPTTNEHSAIKNDQELHTAREKAKESDRLKTSFLYNLSHEIRTPLNGIMGFSNLLLNSDKTVDIRRFSEIINKSGRQILNVVDDLSIVSSLISGNIKVQNKITKLVNLYEETKLMLYEEHLASEKKDKVKLKFKKSKKLMGQLVNIDSSIFKVVAQNLIRNAFKFSEEGYVEFGLADINEKENVFYIKDTGIGIEKEKQEVIFQLFRQGSDDTSRLRGGIGIGLSLSKSLIELLNGRIWIDSKVGIGTTVYFTIPLEGVKKIESESSVDNSDNLNDSPLKGLTVLVVEDQEYNFILLNELLVNAGAKVLHSASGEEAVYTIQEGNSVDLVLMDLQLPGMDGFKATRLIKEINPQLVVIAQSAFAMPQDQTKALEAGCDDFLAKPINNTLLIQKIVANS